MMSLEDTWFVAAFHSTPMHDPGLKEVRRPARVCVCKGASALPCLLSCCCWRRRPPAVRRSRLRIAPFLLLYCASYCAVSCHTSQFGGDGLNRFSRSVLCRSASSWPSFYAASAARPPPPPKPPPHHSFPPRARDGYARRGIRRDEALGAHLGKGVPWRLICPVCASFLRKRTD